MLPLHDLPAGTSALIGRPPVVLWGTGSSSVRAHVRLQSHTSKAIYKPSDEKKGPVMKNHAADMDRYPSVVLIDAFDKGVSNAFEKDFLQVSLSVPLFRSKASHGRGRHRLRIERAK